MEKELGLLKEIINGYYERVENNPHVVPTFHMDANTIELFKNIFSKLMGREVFWVTKKELKEVIDNYVPFTIEDCEDMLKPEGETQYLYYKKQQAKRAENKQVE